MDHHSPHAAHPTTVGDYELHELLDQGPLTVTYRAVQRSVNRPVLLDRLRGELASAAVVEQFFADVRAKAAVDHPLIASIYEAVSTPGTYFFTRENLAGASLLDLHEANVRLTPLEMARVIKRVADASMYFEGRGINTVPLAPAHVFIEKDGFTRLVNVAVAGVRAADAYIADTRMLGMMLEDMVRDDLEGATRIRTLLAWMTNLERPQPLTWGQILSYAEQVEQQLTAPTYAPQPAPTHQAQQAPKSKLPVMLGAGAAVVAVGVLALLLGGNKRPAEPRARDLSAVVEVAAGNYPTPDGGTAKLGGFQLDAHEVSIGEYREFLNQLNALPEAQRSAYDHPDQPAGKANHEPDEWNSMLAAALTGGTWHNLPIGLDFPVVLVDWWDAYAYARWRHGRLPTQNEWYAAASQTGSPGELPPSGWGPVDGKTPDLTPSGLHGLAGNVAEWTGENELNPSVPMNPRSPMTIGGSYKAPAGGANAREWVDRSLRRDDLGFRVLHGGPAN